jgi:hypothetical protein
MLYSVEVTINNQEVYLAIEDDCEIIFTVDGTLDKVKTNKVAITKWLLKEWGKVKIRFSYLHCKPYKDDGNAEYRKKAFNKLGFKSERDILFFGDKTNAPILIPCTFGNGTLIVAGYYYPAIELPYYYKRRNELIVTSNIEGYFYKAVIIPISKRKELNL